MSVHVTSWVLKQSDERLGRRLVLLVLADHANHDGTGAYPAVETIAEEARLSVSQAKRCLRDLRESGAIQKTGTMPAGNAIYSVVMGAHIATPGQNAPGSKSAEGGAQIGPKGGRNMRPEPSKEQPSEEQPSGTVVARARDDVEVVYETWRQERGKTRKAYERISPNRRTKIEARLREFTAAELCEAIRGVARDPWKDRPLHDDLVVIFRNREQVEKFLELAAGTAANGRGTSADAVRIVEETLARTRGAR